MHYELRLPLLNCIYNGISNFTVCLNGLFMQNAACCFDKKRNRAVDYGNQAWNNNIFAAHGDCSMEFDILLGVILLIF